MGREASSARDQVTHLLSGDQAYWRISKAVAVSTSVTSRLSTVTYLRRCIRSDQRSFLLSGDQTGA